MQSKIKEGALLLADCETITPGLDGLSLDFVSKKKNYLFKSHCSVFCHSKPNLIPNALSHSNNDSKGNKLESAYLFIILLSPPFLPLPKVSFTTEETELFLVA